MGKKAPPRAGLFLREFDLRVIPRSTQPPGVTMKKFPSNLSCSMRKTGCEVNERKQETRRKILIGAYTLKKAKEENRLPDLHAEMLTFLTRKIDRILFEEGSNGVTFH